MNAATASRVRASSSGTAATAAAASDGATLASDMLSLLDCTQLSCVARQQKQTQRSEASRGTAAAALVHAHSTPCAPTSDVERIL